MISTVYFKDKKVELVAQEIAKRLDSNCDFKLSKKKIEKKFKQDLKFLAGEPIKGESEVFNNLILKNYYLEISKTLCNRYKSNNTYDVSNYLKNDHAKIFYSYITPEYAVFDKYAETGITPHEHNGRGTPRSEAKKTENKESEPKYF